MFDSLPVIIVTAKTKTAATEVISEIIDNDVTDEAQAAGDKGSDRVWRLVNKYYRADVCVQARAEADPPRQQRGPVEAHVVLLAPDEVQGGAGAEIVARRLASAAPAAAVKVVACDAASVPAGVAAACAARRAEPVALRGARADGEGVAAARAALHAHVWPGLQRVGGGCAPLPLSEAGFAAALETLGAAAARAATLQGAPRRDAAAQLVAHFAACIGHEPDELDVDDGDAQ